MQMLVKEAVSNMKNTLYGIGLDIGVRLSAGPSSV